MGKVYNNMDIQEIKSAYQQAMEDGECLDELAERLRVKKDALRMRLTRNGLSTKPLDGRRNKIPDDIFREKFLEAQKKGGNKHTLKDELKCSLPTVSRMMEALNLKFDPKYQTPRKVSRMGRAAPKIRTELGRWQAIGTKFANRQAGLFNGIKITERDLLGQHKEGVLDRRPRLPNLEYYGKCEKTDGSQK